MIKKVQNEMIKQQIDTLWVTDAVSIHFLTHLKIEAMERFIGLCFRQSGRPLLFLNELFVVEETVLVDIVWINDADSIQDLLIKHSFGVVGVDKYMRAQEVLGLVGLFSVVNGSGCIDKWRAIKTDEQIQKMKVASNINDEVMSQVCELLVVGVSEKEVADKIEDLFYELGADSLSFETIVAFGENAADPHAIPGNRTLKENDCVIVDMGCVKDGYCSDMTRTFIMGDNPLMKKLLGIVKKAHDEAVKAIQPGVTFCEIDEVARSIIRTEGYGKEFNHRLGHGIGQEVHEPYDVSANNEALIEPGMCFSIEPGIYLKGIGGVRYENLVYVNNYKTATLLNNVQTD